MNLLFPELCLHCRAPTKHLFCEACAPFFEPIAAKAPDSMASALEYRGPVIALVNHLKYGAKPYLAKTAAALMILRFFSLNWPLPDLIVPLSRPWLRALFRGGNPMHLIAKELGKSLSVPSLPCLKCSSTLAQARLTLEQRQKIGRKEFWLRRRVDLAGKTLLLIDDVTTTGATLRAAKEALEAGAPKHIYTLTLACAPQ